MRTSNLAIDPIDQIDEGGPDGPYDKAAAQRASIARLRALGQRERASWRPARGLRERTSPRPAYQERTEWREVLRDLRIEPEGLARNAVRRCECVECAEWARARHTIDVATGKVVLAHRDVALGAASALTFDRVWVSSSTYGGPLGHGWHHAYDLSLSNRADTVAIRMPDARVSWFTAPDAGGEAFDSSEQLRLSRDAYGFRLRDASGCEFRFVPHRSQHAFVLSSMRALYGCELRFAYDHRARLVRVAARGDCDLELQYDRADRVIAICAAAAQRGAKRVTVAQYGYDARGNLTHAADALGQSRGYAYEKHLVTRWADRSGGATRFEWDGPDSRARCVHMSIEPGAWIRTLEYAERVTRVRDSFGHQVRFVHDGTVVKRIENARGRVRQIVRGKERRVERDVNSMGRAVTREYDACGRLTKQRGPDGATWSFERDECGRVVRAIDPFAGCWQLTYDSRGRVLSRTDPLGRVTRYQYRGRWLVAVIKPGDRRVRYAYDDAGHLASRTEPGGRVVSSTYDAWGRVVAIQAPDAGSHERQYDSVGRLIRACDGESGARELAYDAEGRLVRWKDPFREVRFTYQGTGLLNSRTEAGMTVCFDYDAEERLVAIVNEGGKVFQLARDASGEIVETTGFDGCKRRYARDVLGRIARVERAGDFSEYEYDAAGRPIEVHHSDGAFEGFRYRADGALMGGWNQDHTLTFERDRCRQVTREFDGDHCVASQFDAAGLRTEVVSSFGPHQVFERDAAGRLARIVERTTGFELRIERDARGFEALRASAAGRCTREHDAAGRPRAVRYEDASGNVLRELSYAWDDGQRLTRFTDSTSEGAEYGYDLRGNLTWRKTEHGIHQRRVSSPTGELFQREDRRDREYGAAGQLLARSGRFGEVTYRYDDAGRLIERCERGQPNEVRPDEEGGEGARDSPSANTDGARWHFRWSASGLLRSVLRPDGSEVTFGYDALGRRVWKKHRGQTTRFVWDGMHLLHEWVEGELQPTTWIYDPDEGHPIAKLVGRDAFAVWVDLHGAPVQLLDARGQQLWAVDTTFTGDVRSVRGPRDACLLRGSSMYEDLETGLYCECRASVPARYYDPVAGAYVCQGALASPPSLRPYSSSFDFGVEWSERAAKLGPGESQQIESCGLSGSLLQFSVGPAGATPSDAELGLIPHRADRAALRASDMAPLWAASSRQAGVPALDLACAFESAGSGFNPAKAGPQPRPLLSR